MNSLTSHQQCSVPKRGRRELGTVTPKPVKQKFICMLSKLLRMFCAHYTAITQSYVSYYTPPYGRGHNATYAARSVRPSVRPSVPRPNSISGGHYRFAKRYLVLYHMHVVLCRSPRYVNKYVLQIYGQ